ncbi:hypothetical protein ACLM5H_08795 [Fredinandcohnia humi]
MKRLKYVGVAGVIMLLIGVAILWATAKMKDHKDMLNNSDAFVNSNNGTVYWFELTSRRGKVEGKLHQQRFIEKVGKAPVMEEKKYPLAGEITENGYVFRVNIGDELITFDAWFSGPHLSVQKHGEKDNVLYNPVNQEELNGYVKALQDYHTEEKEKKRMRFLF